MFFESDVVIRVRAVLDADTSREIGRAEPLVGSLTAPAQTATSDTGAPSVVALGPSDTPANLRPGDAFSLESDGPGTQAWTFVRAV